MPSRIIIYYSYGSASLKIILNSDIRISGSHGGRGENMQGAFPRNLKRFPRKPRHVYVSHSSFYFALFLSLSFSLLLVTLCTYTFEIHVHSGTGLNRAYLHTISFAHLVVCHICPLWERFRVLLTLIT